ncbi:hypothetical protein VIAG107301_00080 [Vibrio agarivorans]
MHHNHSIHQPQNNNSVNNQIIKLNKEGFHNYHISIFAPRE